MTAPAMPDPRRLVRQSVNVAETRLGDRQAAARLVRLVTFCVVQAADMALPPGDRHRLPINTWLADLAAAADDYARKIGA